MADCPSIRVSGRVTGVTGLIVEAVGPGIQVGGTCHIRTREGEPPLLAEVVGFREGRILLMPLEEIRGIAPGALVEAAEPMASVTVGPDLLGRVIDGMGLPMDDKGPITPAARYPIYNRAVNALSRRRISEPIDVGIRAINGLLTIGRGQRMGIFAGSGVGKSVLMGMISRKGGADVNVVGLIGERGRELNDFIERDLGEEGLRRSVLVVATSDRLPLIRMRGAFVATAVAEYFRDQGAKVMLMMDSLTRFAMAQREVGLSAGEPPTTKGYTPSVFALLPQLLERAGTTDHDGDITGLYTVLVEGDDLSEPIADAVRSIIDGHVVLTRELASRHHYPAIDVLSSVSRVMTDVVTGEHRQLAGRFKEIMATYRRAEDLITIGAYAAGTNPRIDRAIRLYDRMTAYLVQDWDEDAGFADSVSALADLFAGE